MSTEPSNVQQPMPVQAELSTNETFAVNSWIFEAVRPFLKGMILELASRTGDFTKYFIANKQALRISDPDAKYCEILKETFQETPEVLSIRRIDTENPAFDKIYFGLFRKFDTVAIFNMSPSNPITLGNIKNLLKSDGYLILVLPTYTGFYPGSDQGLEACSRSNRSYLRSLLGNNIQYLETKFFQLTSSHVNDNDATAPYSEKIPKFPTNLAGILSKSGLFMIAIIQII